MKRPSTNFLLLIIVAGLITGILAGCGGGSGGSGGSSAPTISLGGTGGGNGGPGGSSAPTFVGTAVCQQCHSNAPLANHFTPGDAVDRDLTQTDLNQSSPTFYDSLAGAPIFTAYNSSVHLPSAGDTELHPACENCHGSGAQHYGYGPIPHYMPGIAQCGACHGAMAADDPGHIDINLFSQTMHANPGSAPDEFFFQGGVGTAQASLFGAPEWADAKGTVPVSINQNIQECSVCHSPDTRPGHIAAGDVPNPPQVVCASCHDPHRPAGADGTRDFAAFRGGTVGNEVEVDPFENLNFKPQRVNNTRGTAGFGGTDPVSGTWIRPRLSFDYHKGGDPTQTYVGYANQNVADASLPLADGMVQGNDGLRLTPERLCASCHTRTNYEFGRSSGPAGHATALTSTHQDDVYTQFLNSSHADPTIQNDGTDAGFWYFSLLATVGSRHRPNYPIDMGGLPGETDYPFDGRANGNGADDAQCFQCHNGVAAISYLDGSVGGVALGDSNRAQIVWGDSTLTCITCHDPHQDLDGSGHNVRVPASLSWNTEFLPANAPPSQAALANHRGTVNKFLDLSQIPSGIGDSLICLDCHQGRESGWTAWNKVRRQVLAAGAVTTEAAAEQWWYQNPNTAIPAVGGNAFGFVDNHHLDAAALLYGRNLTEFKGKTYADGIPSHLKENCVGCHMDTPTADNTAGGHTWVTQITTCDRCHADTTFVAPGDYDGDGTVDGVVAELGTATPIDPTVNKNVTVTHNPADEQYGTGHGGTGLMGLLNEALWDSGVEFTGSFPAFKLVGGAAFTPDTLAAAQNLNALNNSGNTGAEAYFFHNPYYAAQILIDSIEALPTFDPANNTLDGPPHTQGKAAPFFRPKSPDSDPNGTITTHSGRDYSQGSFNPSVSYP